MTFVAVFELVGREVGGDWAGRCMRLGGLICLDGPQETMMDHALRTISYIADIGSIVVLMARRRMPRSASQDCIESTPGAPDAKKQYKMICHVFESEDVSGAGPPAFQGTVYRRLQEPVSCVPGH